MHSIKVDRIGETRKNNNGTLMKIIAYRKWDDIDIEFLDDFHFVKEHVTYTNFKRGEVKNPYDRTMCGVGYPGVGEYKIRLSKSQVTKEYECWASLYTRCYSDVNKDRHPAYFDICEVCDEWHDYQNFGKWFDENKYDVKERLHIDKDILYPNSKIYSPKNCILVPQRINMLFLNKPNKRGLPNGIIECSNGYLAKYDHVDLGVCETIEQAYLLYAKRKEEIIKQVADEYKEIIPKKVYNALYNYKVDINNDKNYVCT